MDQNGVVSFRHRRSPSSDRFLGVFSSPQSDNAIGDANVSIAGDELNEDDVFWTGDFAEPQRRSTSPTLNSRRQTFRQPEKFGILAALPEDHRKLNRPVVCRKPSITSSPTSTKLFHSPPISSSHSATMPFSRVFPSIPKPPLDREDSYNRNYSQTMPVRKFQHSVPVNVPMMPKKAPRSGLADVEIDNDEGDDEMLPPHEIVARGSARSPKTTFSVLEGVGRTLKGRDLRRVRNAVFHQTACYAQSMEFVYSLTDNLQHSSRDLHQGLTSLSSSLTYLLSGHGRSTGGDIKELWLFDPLHDAKKLEKECATHIRKTLKPHGYGFSLRDFSAETAKMGISEALIFVFKLQFWRMAVIWTISLILSYFHLFSFPRKSKFYHPSSSSNASITKPICIITGATSGLGAAASYALAKEGYYVVLAGRSWHSLSKIVSGIQEQIDDACVKAFQVDLSSYKSILSFKNSLQQWLLDSGLHCSVQLLINNAGILATSYRITTEQCDQMMSTNYIGPFCLTKLFLPLLEQSPIPSRVVNVTSFTHRSVSSMEITRETISGKCFSKLSSYPFAHVYEYSKLCLLLFTYELHRQVGLMEKSHSISVIAADPGVVKTNIMREIPSCLSWLAFYVLKLLGFLQSPEVGIGSVLDAVHAPTETSGVYFFGGNGRTLRSSRLSYNSKLAKDLWDASSQIFLEQQLASQDTT